jgi:hypothetical protein
MSIKIKDADGNDIYLNGEGAGTVGDPFSPVNQTVRRDQTTKDINLFLVQSLDTFTIDSNRTLDDYVFDITTTGTTPVVGNLVCIKEGTSFIQAEILNVAAVSGNTYTVTLAMELDFAYTTAALGVLGNKNLASGTAAATISSPIKFAVSPAGMASGVEWDITRMLIVSDDSSAVDSWAEFINITALTNGLFMRVENAAGRRETLGNFKTNLDFAADAYDADLFAFGPTAGGMKCRSSFAGEAKRGVVKRLTADDSDEFVMYVRDNITAIDEFFVKVQGHFTD